MSPLPDPTALASNLASLRERIDHACARAGRSPIDVRILAATKYVDAPTIAALVDAGVRDIAENRLEALELKQGELEERGGLDPAVAWHYIGSLQSRKAAAVAARVDMLHSLCTDSAARRLAAHAADGGTLPELLVQVNSAGDAAKEGVAPEQVERFLDDLPEELAVRGFMTMPALADEPEASRPAFERLRDLRDELRPRFRGRHDLEWLSMGTSQDFEVAVEAGATHVRLGRILYVVQE